MTLAIVSRKLCVNRPVALSLLCLSVCDSGATDLFAVAIASDELLSSG